MSESDAVRKTIEEHNANICKWYAAGDADRLSRMFAEDCWQMPPNAEPLVGRDAVRDFWKRAMQWGKWVFTLDTEDVVASGSVAVERGRYTVSFSAGPFAAPGMKSSEDEGHYVVMWRRGRDGQWCIVWDAPVSTVSLPSSR